MLSTSTQQTFSKDDYQRLITANKLKSMTETQELNEVTTDEDKDDEQL
jgi:hypothetical protein